MQPGHGGYGQRRDAVDPIAKLPRAGEKPTEDAVIEMVTVKAG